jgi:hypothetical protein
MLRCTIVLYINILLWNFVFATSAVIHKAAAAVPLIPIWELVSCMASMAALVGLAIFFRPLLVGIARALVLVVRPRRSKDELAARRALRGKRDLQRAINAADKPVQAELRAIVSRA